MTSPNPMTPALSRDLAELQYSPYWRGLVGAERWYTFVEQASQYATYEDLPGDLKAIYQQAQAAREVKPNDE